MILASGKRQEQGDYSNIKDPILLFAAEKAQAGFIPAG